MQVLTRSRQPRPEARGAFDLLVEVFEGKDSLDERAIYDRVSRFVALLQRVTGKMARWRWDFNSEEQREISRWLVLGLQRLRAGQVFQFARDPDASEQGIVWEGNRELVFRAPSRSLKNLFCDLVFDLLIEVGPWLRTCQREGCGRFFLYRRPKQAYCSESCAQRVRMGRFLEQGKAKSSKRPSKSSGRRRQARAAGAR